MRRKRAWNVLMLERRFDEAAHLLEQDVSRRVKESPRVKRVEAWQFLGWVRSLAGNKEGARQAYLEGKTLLELRRQQEPQNYSVAGLLAFCEAGLGEQGGCVERGRAGDVSAAGLPKISVYGPFAEENLAGSRSAGRRSGARPHAPRAAARHALRCISGQSGFVASRSRLGTVAPASALQRRSWKGRSPRPFISRSS